MCCKIFYKPLSKTHETFKVDMDVNLQLKIFRRWLPQLLTPSKYTNDCRSGNQATELTFSVVVPESHVQHVLKEPFLFTVLSGKRQSICKKY